MFHIDDQIREETVILIAS